MQCLHKVYTLFGKVLELFQQQVFLAVALFGCFLSDGFFEPFGDSIFRLFNFFAKPGLIFVVAITLAAPAGPSGPPGPDGSGETAVQRARRISTASGVSVDSVSLLTVGYV